MEKKSSAYKLSIKEWSEDDRPREKLIKHGEQVLSEAELIAVLIGSGNRDESAVELSKRILSSVENDLNQLSKMSVRDLMGFRGIGEAKAISIVAALELGRRRKAAETKKKTTISSSSDAYKLLAPHLEDLPHEEFWVLYLSRSNKVVEKVCVSRGGVTGTVADIRLIFKPGIQNLSSAIIVCHNHPSGNLKPSQSDISLTEKIKKAGETLDIILLDHLIITENDYYSFADHGKL